MQVIERKFQNMLKEIFASVLKYSILHQLINTADQVLHMQAVNFVLMKHN